MPEGTSSMEVHDIAESFIVCLRLFHAEFTMDGAVDRHSFGRLEAVPRGLPCLPMSRMSLYPVWSSAQQLEAYLQLIHLHL